MPEEYKRYTMKHLLKAFEEAGYPVTYMYLKRLEYKGNLILPRSTTNFKKTAGNKPLGAVREMTMTQIQNVVKAFLPGGLGFYDYRKGSIEMDKTKSTQAKIPIEIDFQYEITPLGMLANAKIWHTLYRQNITLNTQHQLVAVYCLLIGFEMLLKSYLILLNEKYCKHRELKRLGHDFAEIFMALSKEKGVKYLKETKEVMAEHKLFETDIDTMRYPKKGNMFWMSGGYYKIPNDFDDLFDHIGDEISREIMDSFYRK